MSSVPDYKTSRTTPYIARTLLRTLGYTTARVSGPDLPIDIIAWKNKAQILLIRVLSLRAPASAETFSHEIHPLTLMAASGTFPGEIQLWIRTQARWNRYRIMAGGSIAIPGVLS